MTRHHHPPRRRSSSARRPRCRGRVTPWTLAGRSVKKMMRHPEQFFDVTLQPVLFLMIFVYVLGGAIAGSTHDYLQFVLPGILIQTVLFSTMSIGVNLNTDIKEGVFDRFRSLPIARSAPLVGATIAECLRYSHHDRRSA